MKKILDGKMYNTETAREMGCWSNCYSRNDFNYVEETLYQKKTGEFFLLGEGGAASKYAVSSGQNTWCGSSKIIPLAFEDAREWAEEKLSAEKYEEIFGPVVEDDTKTTVSFSLRTDTVEKLKKNSSAAGKGLSEYLEEIIEAGVFCQDRTVTKYLVTEVLYFRSDTSFYRKFMECVLNNDSSFAGIDIDQSTYSIYDIEEIYAATEYEAICRFKEEYKSTFDRESFDYFYLDKRTYKNGEEVDCDGITCSDFTDDTIKKCLEYFASSYAENEFEEYKKFIASKPISSHKGIESMTDEAWEYADHN